MQLYFLIACDGLDEKQEKKLKRHLSDLQAALQAYAEEQAESKVVLVNDCESDDCEDWLLGIELPAKKRVALKAPVALFNSLAKQYGIDCEVGSIEAGEREPVSYFGKAEGEGDTFLIAAYLGM